MCKLLLEGDSYFKGKDVNTKKINEKSTIKSYCYNDDCKTNGERINALAIYIHMKFKRSIKDHDYNKYDEYLLMWISDKLYKIHIKSKGKDTPKGFMDNFTLKQAYEEYLKNDKVKSNYWDLLNMQQGLKEAYLRYMAEFYKLLNRICKTIVYYEENKAKSKELSNYSKNCLNEYRNLYINIYECKSYLHLLNKLKGIYDDFRNYAIKENPSNNNLETNLKKLTTPNRVEMNAKRSFKPYKFNKKICYSQKKNTKQKKTDSPGPQASSQVVVSENKGNMKGTTQTMQKNGSDISKGTDDGTGDPGSVSGGGQDSKVGDSDSWREGTSGDARSPNSENEKKNGGAKEPGDPSGGKGSQVNGDDRGNSEPGGAYTEKGGSEGGPGSDKGGSGGSDGKGAKDSEPVGSGSKGGGAGNSDNNLPPNSDKSQQSGDSPQPPPKDPPSQLPPPSPPTPPSTPPSGPPKGPSPNTPQPKQPASQSQPTTQQNPQDDPSNQKKSDKTNLQLATSPSPDPNLKKTWNIIPTTWNGSEDCKPKINFMSATLVCCTSKKCSLTGVSVTLILIPIILLILYKYLSREWTKKSEKKNMKRVIKLVDGKRKTKIIISSYDRNKDLKPIINSVGRKKDPLLNIYKLMQSDPIPFINLFFLLIFFVYKRKHNFIEL
ncbi:hypothetical protein YYE_04916 [Plasmodium vinckei vinckei]|nr:hypothetical protein YYE_04916 [Plasmodium vinckei vinckei]